MDLDRVLIKEGGSPPINSCLEHLQSLRDAGVKSVFHVLFVAEEIGYGHFPADRKIDIDLRERPGEPIHEIALETSEVEFLVTHAECGDLLEVSRTKSGEKRIPQLMPAGKNDSVSLMSEELMRGGLHDVYLHAVNCIRESL